MAINKIVYGGNTLVDLTGDTVTPETLAEGVTAHDKSGSVITGTMRASEDLNALLAEQESLIAELRETLRGKTAGGDGDSDLVLSLLTREITEYSNPTLTYLGPYAMSGTNIASLDLPVLTTIAGYAFYECTKLTSMVFPVLTEVPYNGMRQFKGIVKADFHALRSIGANGFYQCTNLETLIIRTNTLCTLAAGTVMTATKVATGTGYVYVPAVLVDNYKAATNWSAFANQFRAIEDYPDICGG